MPRQYQYVGPTEIAARATQPPPAIETPQQLQQTLASLGLKQGELTVTFIIDLAGHLRIADRRSEHVACAAGQPVLSAGEMTFAPGPSGPAVPSVTNQSTGYCPEPDSYPAVKAALTALGLDPPDGFTPAMIFRRCPKCGQTNLVKEAVFVCGVCEGELPVGWNFG